MRVTVLYGGPSKERDISLVSGRAVIEGLQKAGHEVFGSDVTPTYLKGLDKPCDVVFPVLHGEFGESGELQEILEQRGMPFVGSGSAASRLGMDKVDTKRTWQQISLPTPAWHVATKEDPTTNGVEAPCVVKAIRSGSSIDVHVCSTQPEAESAVRTLVAVYGHALVEKFVVGMELTVGILEEEPLPPIRIAVANGFFDFNAKYATSGGAEHRFDTGLSDEQIADIQEMCLKAHQSIGCRDLSRVDVMLDHDRKPYLLEINTLPGFTPRSLLPEAAAHSGVPFDQLVDRLVKRARDRGAK